MNGLYLIFCLAIIVFLAVVVLVIVILISGRSEKSQPISAPASVAGNGTKNHTPRYKPQKTAVADRPRAEELSPQIHLERSREFIERYNAAEAKEHALAAFRGGDRAIRLQAVQLLSALYEVEEF